MEKNKLLVVKGIGPVKSGEGDLRTALLGMEKERRGFLRNDSQSGGKLGRTAWKQPPVLKLQLQKNRTNPSREYSS